MTAGHAIDNKKLDCYVHQHPSATTKEIANAFGCAKSTIRQHINQLKDGRISGTTLSTCIRNSTSTKTEKPVRISKSDLVQYLDNHPNKSRVDIANHFAITVKSLMKRINRYKISYDFKIANRYVSDTAIVEYCTENPTASLVTVAAHFNRQPNSIDKRLKKLNLTVSRNNPYKRKLPDDPAVVQQYIDDHPEQVYKDLGDHFGCDKTTIRKYVVRHKLSYVSKSSTTQTPRILTKLELQSYIAKHPEKNLKEIANHFGCTDSAVSRNITQYKLPYTLKANTGIDKHELQSCINSHPTYTQHQLAIEFNCSDSVISHAISKYHINYNHKHAQNSGKETERIKPVTDTELLDYMANNPKQSRSDINRHFNRKPKSLDTRMKRLYPSYKYGNKKKLALSANDIIAYTETHPDDNLKQIADHFDCTANTIKKRLKSSNQPIVLPHSFLSQTDLLDYVLKNPTLKAPAIANHFGCSVSSIHRGIQQLQTTGKYASQDRSLGKYYVHRMRLNLTKSATKTDTEITKADFPEYEEMIPLSLTDVCVRENGKLFITTGKQLIEQYLRKEPDDNA